MHIAEPIAARDAAGEQMARTSPPTGLSARSQGYLSSQPPLLFTLRLCTGFTRRCYRYLSGRQRVQHERRHREQLPRLASAVRSWPAARAVPRLPRAAARHASSPLAWRGRAHLSEGAAVFFVRRGRAAPWTAARDRVHERSAHSDAHGRRPRASFALAPLPDGERSGRVLSRGLLWDEAAPALLEERKLFCCWSKDGCRWSCVVKGELAMNCKPSRERSGDSILLLGCCADET
mmetsp:Transcript_30654/g.79624  ORF Transcript_30654/g.79624 Transcript_30654/m.79624 type:complete len:234 (-) Transcript_30654:87-788(-)